MHEDNTISIISPKSKHAVATGGRNVQTAGHLRFDGTTLRLDNNTGHYRTHLQSLPRAYNAFQNLGFNDVKVVTNTWWRGPFQE